MDILGRVVFPRQLFKWVPSFQSVATLESNTLPYPFHLGWGFYLEKLQGVHPFQSVASLGSNVYPIPALWPYGFSLSGVSLQDYSVESPSRNHDPTLRITTLGLVFAYYVSYLSNVLRRGE